MHSLFSCLDRRKTTPYSQVYRHRLILWSTGWTCFAFKEVVWHCRGVARNLLRGGQNKESGGQKPPSRVQGQSPNGDLGVKPPEAGDIYRMHNKENKPKYTTLLYIYAYFLYYAFSITQRKLTQFYCRHSDTDTSSINRHTLRLETRKHWNVKQITAKQLSRPILHYYITSYHCMQCSSYSCSKVSKQCRLAIANHCVTLWEFLLVYSKITYKCHTVIC